MKKYLGIVISITSLGVLYAADFTHYQNIVPIQEIKVNQPAIVQITNPDSLGAYILINDKGDLVPQQLETNRTVKIVPPIEVEACRGACVSALQIADGDERTTFDFPLLSKGIQKGKITILYKNPIETDAIIFHTTGDSYMPTSFTLTIDGKHILNTTEGGRVKFPKMLAKDVEIEFDYNQPIRFTEVGIGSDKEEEVTTMMRFVYQPGIKYGIIPNYRGFLTTGFHPVLHL